MKKSILAVALAAVSIPACAITTPALADPPPWAPAHGWRDHHDGDRWEHGRGYRDDGYDRYGRYREPRPITSRDRVWRGNDGRYYCRRSNGTTGLIIGAAGGALIGRAIDTRGDRALGTILGGAGGALLGREIDRSNARCR